MQVDRVQLQGEWMQAETNNMGLEDTRRDREKDGSEKELKAGAGKKQRGEREEEDNSTEYTVYDRDREGNLGG